MRQRAGAWGLQGHSTQEPSSPTLWSSHVKLWTACIHTAARERIRLPPCLNHCHFDLCFSQTRIPNSTASPWQVHGVPWGISRSLWLAFQSWLDDYFFSLAFSRKRIRHSWKCLTQTLPTHLSTECWHQNHLETYVKQILLLNSRGFRFKGYRILKISISEAPHVIKTFNHAFCGLKSTGIGMCAQTTLP